MRTLINLLAILFIAILAACSKPSYFGKTYSPTQNVDIYLDKTDVKKITLLWAPLILRKVSVQWVLCSKR